mgnify:CR=1 FL=1
MNGIIAMESRMQRKLHVRFGGGNRADSRSSTTPTQLTETAGPYYFDCPASILDLLGPPLNDHAAEWRARCRQRLALTSRRKPKSGDTLVLPEPLTFSDGISEQTFRVGSWGTRTVLLRAGDGAGVRISRLMSRAWTIVAPEAAASAASVVA